MDHAGRDLQAGDWVRLIAIPAGVTAEVPDTYQVFQKALGQTFRIEAFDKYGHAELDLSRKVANLNVIWVEPEYLLRTRRKQTVPGSRKA